jgi:pyruvate/2-oxoglutarate dehydrogenase complex dihydrolipoamide acyltransferase (E2) component
MVSTFFSLQTTIPHAYGVTDCTVDKLIALRKQLKEEDGVKVSVNDFVIKAVALALQQCPQVNALYKGEEVCYHHHHHNYTTDTTRAMCISTSLSL